MCSERALIVGVSIIDEWVPGTPKDSEGHERGEVAMFGDEGDDAMTRWGALVVIALSYVAIGAWDWTDTVEVLAR